MPYLMRSGLPVAMTAFELLLEFVAGLDLRGAAEDDRELLFDRGKGHAAPNSVTTEQLQLAELN